MSISTRSGCSLRTLWSASGASAASATTTNSPLPESSSRIARRASESRSTRTTRTGSSRGARLVRVGRRVVVDHRDGHAADATRSCNGTGWGIWRGAGEDRAATAAVRGGECFSPPHVAKIPPPWGPQGRPFAYDANSPTSRAARTTRTERNVDADSTGHAAVQARSLRGHGRVPHPQREPGG